MDEKLKWLFFGTVFHDLLQVRLGLATWNFGSGSAYRFRNFFGFFHKVIFFFSSLVKSYGRKTVYFSLNYHPRSINLIFRPFNLTWQKFTFYIDCSPLQDEHFGTLTKSLGSFLSLPAKLPSLIHFRNLMSSTLYTYYTTSFGLKRCWNQVCLREVRLIWVLMIWECVKPPMMRITFYKVMLKLNLTPQVVDFSIWVLW